MTYVNQEDPLGIIWNNTSNSYSNGQDPGTYEDGDSEPKAIKEPHVDDRNGDEKDGFVSC